ncbi:MAG: thiamine phosphate synthase [Rubricoccaceae bacterium]
MPGTTCGLGRLHVLTDFHFQQRHSHAALARLAAAGGADTIQFRQKAGTPRDWMPELRATAAACRAAGVPLVVDDRLDLALAAGADGVHLGQLDLPVRDARRILDALGGAYILGATASSADEARRAEGDGATYVGFGPVYPTGSKANPESVKGLRGLEAACRAVTIPVIAIAGITAERVPEVLGAGAYGVAVMTAVTTAPDPQAATAAFRAALEACAPARTPA